MAIAQMGMCWRLDHSMQLVEPMLHRQTTSHCIITQLQGHYLLVEICILTGEATISPHLVEPRIQPLLFDCILIGNNSSEPIDQTSMYAPVDTGEARKQERREAIFNCEDQTAEPLGWEIVKL